MKIGRIACSVALFCWGISVASASTVSLTKQNPFDTFNGGGHQRVHIRSYSPWVDQTVTAGGFRINDGINNIIAWCLDISHKLSLPSTYETTDTPFTNSRGLNSNQKANVEKLFNANYSTLDLTSNAQSAGFQLALWELLYEHNSTFDVTDGWFVATSSWHRSMSHALQYANQFLGNLDGAISQNYKLTYYQSTGHSQNLVSATAVPIPAAGLMLGFGLAGLYCAGRRRKTRAVSQAVG